jgi:hypothetical protein
MINWFSDICVQKNIYQAASDADKEGLKRAGCEDGEG